MALIEIAPLTSLACVLPLRRLAREEGWRFLDRLFDEWASGAARFSGRGEEMLCARLEGRVAGVGGLCRDPFAGDRRIGRIRHVYVAPAFRGLGIARALVGSLVADAGAHFTALRLVTENPAADALYRACGFRRAAGDRQTHRLDLAGDSPCPLPIPQTPQ